MLFNISSCLIVFMIVSMPLYVYGEKVTPKDERNMDGALTGGFIVLVIFIWVMSLMNWWR